MLTIMETPTYRSADEVRTVVKRHLTDAEALGTHRLPANLAEVVFNTDLHVVEAAAMALTEGGDTFPSELTELLSQHQEGELSDDGLAFRVAMAVFTR